jgi:hypothetical protein
MRIWAKDMLADAAKRNITKRFIDERLVPLLDEQ